MSRVGYLTGLLPGSMKNGTEIATAMISDAMEQCGDDFRLMGFKRAGDLAIRNDAVVLDEITIDQVSASFKDNVSWSTNSLLRREPISVSKFRSAKSRNIKRYVEDLDLLLIDKPQMALLYFDQIASIPFSIVWHAIEWKTYGGVAESSSGLKKIIYSRESKLCRDMERKIARSASHVFSLTESDEEDIRLLGYRGPVQRLPLIVGHNDRSEVYALRSSENYVGLLGNWNWSANLDGLQWFCKEVVPLLPKNIGIKVGGRGSEKISYSGVTSAGEVDSAQKFLGNASVVAIPLITGTGVSMKVIEACSEGWPTVTTIKGVRGLPTLPPNIQVADSPEEFAEKVRLMSDLDENVREQWRSESRKWANDRNDQFVNAVKSGVGVALGDIKR